MTVQPHPAAVSVQICWSDGEVYAPIKLAGAKDPRAPDVWIANMLAVRSYRGGYSLAFRMADGSRVLAKRRLA